MTAALAGCRAATPALEWSPPLATILAPSEMRPPGRVGRFGSDGFDSVAAVAAMPDGALAVAGHFEGELALGSDQLVSAGDSDAFLAVVEPDGQVRWAARLGGAGFDAATAVVIDRAGEPVLVGDFQGTVRAGARRLAARGEADMFAAGFAPDGTVRWATALGGPGWDAAAGAALTAAGEIAIAGTSRADGEPDVLVALLGRNGAVIRTRSFGGPGWDQALAIAADQGGDIAVAGSFTERMKIDDSPLVSAGRGDGFVARLAPGGTLVRAERLGGTGDDAVTAVAFAPDGSAALAGHFAGTIRVGGIRLASAGDSDIVAARLDRDGAVTWASRIGGAGADEAHAIALLPDGSLLVAATYSLALAGGGPSEAVLHRFDPGGGRRDLVRVSGFFVSARALAVTTDGVALLGGSFAGRARFQGRVIEAVDALDGFLVSAPIDGEPLP